MRDFLEKPVALTAAFRAADEAALKGTGPVRVSGAVESLKAYMMYRAGLGKTRLLVSYDEVAAKAVFEDIRFFDKTAEYFPGKDLLFYSADAKSNTLTEARLRTIKGLLTGKVRTVVTTPEGMLNTLLPLNVFKDSILKLREADEIEIETLRARLTEMGYERVARVEEGGQFAIHGGIVDIYDMTEELPVRIEFFGDEIDTIRLFHVTNQLSAERIPETEIFPATEFVLSEEVKKEGFKRIRKDYEKQLNAFKKKESWEEAATLQKTLSEAEDGNALFGGAAVLERFLPYFYEEKNYLENYFPEDPVIILDEPIRIEERGKLLETEFTYSFKNRLLKGLTLGKCAGIMRPLKQFFAAADTGRTLVFTGLDSRVKTLEIKESLRMDCRSVAPYSGNLKGLFEDLSSYRKQAYSMVLLVSSKTRGLRMAEEFTEKGIDADYIGDADEIEEVPGKLYIRKGALRRGFVLPMQKFVLLSESDLQGTEKKVRRTKPVTESGEKIRSFGELSFGDYVVHEKYGIGIYQGIVKLDVDNVSRDYIKIAYAGGSNLYITVTNLSAVQKYAGQDAHPPKINSLDSPEWGRTKSRVKAAVKEVAEELINLYAVRESAKGHVYRKDTEWQQEFEEMFPYQETEDQLNAIKAVKKDMESGKIMDRLICGDVGFGKTEVAIRAAFKAVQEGKQVAYLVPTTILAKQHYNTFVERMKDYPVTVEMLSRFTSADRTRKITEGLRTGMTDIVIGTHKLLSDKLKFKDLGLLIIDEEQRFGVGHKEKIKQMKQTVDVLTLSATPIPRTLHMAMVGIRDMSILTEPPENRKSVQTYVMEYEEELVREAILREVRRGGQVYYVYNRARDIDDIASRLQELLPDVRIDFIHGKMKEEEIERKMLSFIEGEIDVLVSTTIIETGIDIPNVNTIIIHDAERYGLSQLYQLRGRVGRSNRQAYAFIMYRKDHIPSEEAEKRLEAIRQFTELGSGIRIAEEDLAIRGAGAVLGNAQSGHMARVGYDLYAKLLREAVKRAKDEDPEIAPVEDEEQEEVDTVIDIKVDAYVPDRYMPSEMEKLELYKRISCLENGEECENLKDELIDRFGDIPLPVENLMRVATLKLIAKALYISEIKGSEATLRFTFVPTAKIRVENLPELLKKMGGAMRFEGGENPALIWRERNEYDIGKRSVLEILSELLNTTKELLI